jgi:hypothetical protein
MAFFGFDSNGTDFLANTTNFIGGGLQSAAEQGLNEVVGKASGALGKFGASLSSVNPRGWLGRAINRPDPHINLDWSVVLPNDKNDLASYVEEVPELPITQFGVSPGIFRGGQRIYLPVEIETDSLTLVFYEDRLGTTTGYLQSWFDKVGSRSTGLMGYPSEYKQNITIVLQDTKQSTVMSLLYYGCWPTKASNISLGSSQAGRTTISANFSVDGMLVSVATAKNGSSVNSLFQQVKSDASQLVTQALTFL